MHQLGRSGLSRTASWKRRALVALGVGGAALGIAVGSAYAATPGSAGTYSFFDQSVPASAQLDPENASLELGLRFKTSASGQITAVRFLKAAGDTDSRSVTVWQGGKAVATAKSSNESASGWQTVKLAQPLKISKGNEYTVSYHANRYMATQNYFKQSVSKGPLTAPADHNGVFSYGSDTPQASYMASNYWVDVVFVSNGARHGSTGSTVVKPTTTVKATTTTAGIPAPTSTTSTSVPSDTTPTTTPSTVPPVAGAALNLPRIPWEGGSAYWAKFPKASAAGWSNPNFFPIAVFLGKPEHAAALKAVGVNTYMAVEHDPAVEPLSYITDQGMYFLPQQGEWTAAEVGNNANAVGWFISDECEMGLGCGGKDEYANLAEQKASVNTVKSRNDGRFTFANYGNGVLGTFWAPNTMSQFVQVVDATAVDKYAYTSPQVRFEYGRSPNWPTGANAATSAAYGWQADQMAKYQDPNNRHPIWIHVEAAKPYLTEDGAAVITPDQIEGAVWSAIIHEARGISYFQHNNDPSCGNYALVQCPQALKDRVKAIDASVQSLAPVINTQSYVWNFNSGTDTMLKTSGGSAYIFSDIGISGKTGAHTFTLSAGVGGTTVEVVGENRTLAVSGGKFTDTFAAEYSHHTYKLALG